MPPAGRARQAVTAFGGAEHANCEFRHSGRSGHPFRPGDAAARAFPRKPPCAGFHKPLRAHLTARRAALPGYPVDGMAGRDHATAVTGIADHVPRNRAAWDRWAEEYAGPGLRNWAAAEPSWGIWEIAEAQAGVLPGDRGQTATPASTSQCARNPDMRALAHIRPSGTPEHRPAGQRAVIKNSSHRWLRGSPGYGPGGRLARLHVYASPRLGKVSASAAKCLADGDGYLLFRTLGQ